MNKCLLLMSARNEHKVEHELSDTSVVVTEWVQKGIIFCVTNIQMVHFCSLDDGADKYQRLGWLDLRR